MDSLRNLYKIGNGPSSSHTMGPQIASLIFLNRNPNATIFKVELYGSLALTGKGHLTDYIIKKTLGEARCEVIFNFDKTYTYHPNALRFRAFVQDKLVDEWLVFSVGGGALKEIDEDRSTASVDIYPHKTMKEILSFCKAENLSLVDYVRKYDENILEYLHEVLRTMEKAINRGLNNKEILPGRLKVNRRAHSFFKQYQENKSFDKLLYAYSLATAEENASAGQIVTAPTCGASGVVPAVLFSSRDFDNIKEEKLVDSLMVAGLIGNLIKFNGSISGAEVGCQGEVGAACSMASAARCFILGGTNEQIEYAAEIALEHHLGLTCDPVDGVVQIPCIERNALASAKACDSANYALCTDGIHYISLDDVINVMMETGIDLHHKYKETSIGGLASKKFNC